MPISTSWYQPHILLLDIRDDVTASEVCNAIAQTIAICDAAQQPIRMISDWRKAACYPIHYDMMSLILQMVQHPNMDWIVVLGMSPTLNFWAKLVSQIARPRYHVADTLDEALEFLVSLPTRV